MRIVLLYLIFRMCQASPLAENVPKNEPHVLKKIVNKLEKTPAWNTLKNWYEKAREWLVGEDGFITTFYKSTGDPPKKRCKCCRRCCPRRNKNHPVHTKTDYPARYPQNRYPHGGYGYPYRSDGRTNNYYFIDTNTQYGNGGDGWPPFDSSSLPAPLDGNGPQVVVSGNGDNGCQMDCGICPDCSGLLDCSNCPDCSGCGDCITGFLCCFCQPDVCNTIFSQ